MTSTQPDHGPGPFRLSRSEWEQINGIAHQLRSWHRAARLLGVAGCTLDRMLYGAARPSSVARVRAALQYTYAAIGVRPVRGEA